MNTILPAAALILFGLCWTLYATLFSLSMRMRAESDASHLESSLQQWAESKIQEGKLQESDVAEIFPDGRSLRFGGESPQKNFRTMIADIVKSSTPPAWPGVLSLLIGGASLFIAIRKKRRT